MAAATRADEEAMQTLRDRVAKEDPTVPMETLAAGLPFSAEFLSKEIGDHMDELKQSLDELKELLGKMDEMLSAIQHDTAATLPLASQQQFQSELVNNPKLVSMSERDLDGTVAHQMQTC